MTERKGKELAAEDLRTATKLSTFVVRSGLQPQPKLIRRIESAKLQFARALNSRDLKTSPRIQGTREFVQEDNKGSRRATIRICLCCLSDLLFKLEESTMMDGRLDQEPEISAGKQQIER